MAGKNSRSQFPHGKYEHKNKYPKRVRITLLHNSKGQQWQI